MTQYFRDVLGNYLGGFDGATPPNGSIEIPAPPESGTDKWNGTAWIASPARVAEAAKAAEVLAVKNDPSVQALLALSPVALATSVESMVTLVQIKAEVKRLAMMVNVLAKLAKL